MRQGQTCKGTHQSWVEMSERVGEECVPVPDWVPDISNTCLREPLPLGGASSSESWSMPAPLCSGTAMVCQPSDWCNGAGMCMDSRRHMLGDVNGAGIQIIKDDCLDCMWKHASTLKYH